MRTGTGFTHNRSFGILLLRIFVGLRILYGVVDNILSWEKMMEFSSFLEAFRFPAPTVSAVISVYAQFFAAVFILLGFKIRFFSSLMAFNFLVALVFVHLPANDTIEVMTPALALLSICLTFIFTGAERYSLDKVFSKVAEGSGPSKLKTKNTLPGQLPN